MLQLHSSRRYCCYYYLITSYKLCRHSSNRWTQYTGSYPQQSKVPIGTQLYSYSIVVTPAIANCKYKLPILHVSRQQWHTRSPVIIVASAIEQLPDTQVAKHTSYNPSRQTQSQVASNYQLETHNWKHTIVFSNCKLPTQQLHYKLRYTRLFLGLFLVVQRNCCW